MKQIIIIIVLLIMSINVQAQNYEKAVGVRLGLHQGVTYKQFINYKMALEGIVATRWRGWEIVGLIEYHNKLDQSGSLNWFYGFGGHLGFYNAAYTEWDTSNKDYMVIGADGIIGVEYKLDNFPVSFSIDWKPYLNIIGNSRFFGDAGGLSIRYIF